MGFDDRQLGALRTEAEHVTREVCDLFREGIGARPDRVKGDGDFATSYDLRLESLISRTLRHRTGLPCGGEEYGEVSTDAPAHWVIDPIDGTSNFSAGNPDCCVVAALVEDGVPVVGVTAVPLTHRLYSAHCGSPLHVDGAMYTPTGHEGMNHHIGYGSIVSPAGSRTPTHLRSRLLARLISTYPRLRITGSVALDLAYVACGIFGGAVSFSPHVWDNAAGYVLTTAAGAVVTDLDGHPWQCGAAGMIAATPAIHATIVEIMQDLLNEDEGRTPA